MIITLYMRIMLFLLVNYMYHDEYNWKYLYYFTCFHSTSSVPLTKRFKAHLHFYEQLSSSLLD